MFSIKQEANTPERNIEIVSSLLTRLRHFKRAEAQTLPLLGQFLLRFKSALPELVQKEKDWKRDAAPNFNIFRVLRLQRRETKLHSRFLAELLDPNGSHGQGERFLIAFLEMCEQCGMHRPREWPKDPAWDIRIEVVTKWGRLDIVIRSEPAKFVMVIENKVDADEGTEQLDRYNNWLSEQPTDYRNLVFLTPDMRTPETISEAKWNASLGCFCLSYGEHIEEWLSVAAREIQAPRLRFVIDQYLQVVESL